MSKSQIIFGLSILAAILILFSSAAGIGLDDGGKTYTASNFRGDDVRIYGGDGIYRNDSVQKAVLFRGFDWANLVISLPVLLWGIVASKKNRLIGKMAVASVFCYLAYNYLIGAMGNAFNNLFLVWTALFSVGLFGLALLLTEKELTSLSTKIGRNFPRKSLSVYLIILGLFLMSQYLMQIIPAMLTGKAPLSLEIYTTLELAALELGIMIPLHLAGGLMLWKNQPAGYVLSILLTFTAMMTFISLSVAALIFRTQYASGVFMDLFVPIVLSFITIGFSVSIIKNIRDL